MMTQEVVRICPISHRNRPPSGCLKPLNEHLCMFLYLLLYCTIHIGYSTNVNQGNSFVRFYAAARVHRDTDYLIVL